MTTQSDLTNQSPGMVFRGRQTVTKLAAGTMSALLPATAEHDALPFPGAALTLDATLSTAKRLDAEGHAPDHIARMVIGADRTADSAPLYRIFEHFSNALAIIESRMAAGQSTELATSSRRK